MMQKMAVQVLKSYLHTFFLSYGVHDDKLVDKILLLITLLKKPYTYVRSWELLLWSSNSAEESKTIFLQSSDAEGPSSTQSFTYSLMNNHLVDFNVWRVRKTRNVTVRRSFFLGQLLTCFWCICVDVSVAKHQNDNFTVPASSWLYFGPFF